MRPVRLPICVDHGLENHVASHHATADRSAAGVMQQEMYGPGKEIVRACVTSVVDSCCFCLCSSLSNCNDDTMLTPAILNEGCEHEDADSHVRH
jgi:hypothetical protein